MPIFTRKKQCPHCDQTIDASARFCPRCGKPTGAVLGPCPHCGEMVAANAQFCPSCGRQLGGRRAPDIRRSVWRKSPDEFAVRVEPADLRGALYKELEVQPGQQVVLLVDGRADEGRKGPGRYTVDSLFERLLTLGSGRHVTGLLVDGGHVPLEFQLPKLYSRDDYEISGRCVVGVQMVNPVAFLVNVMKSERSYTLNDLRSYLSDEVRDAIQETVGQQDLSDLATGLALKDQLANAVEVHLNETLRRSGLQFGGVRTGEFEHPRLEKLRAQWEAIRIEGREAEASLADRQARFKADHDEEDQETAEQRAQARTYEERAVVWEQMRRAILSENMNEVRSKEDLQDFLAEINERQLVRQEQLDVLAEEFDQRKEDRVKARAHAAYLAELERDYNRKQAELVWHTDFSLEQMASELKIEQQRLADEGALNEQRWQEDLSRMVRGAERADWERAEQHKAGVFDRQREKDEDQHHRELGKAQAIHQGELLAIETDASLSVEQKRAETTLAVSRLQAEQKTIEVGLWKLQEAAEQDSIQRDLDMGLDALKRMKGVKREDELLRADAEHGRILDLRDQDRLDEAQQHTHELATMQVRSEMSAEALMSLSAPDQARAIADLKRTETMKGMTDEQVYALMAAESPQLAAALTERFKALAARPEEMEAQVRSLYERMLVDIQKDREKEAELRQRTEERFQKMFSEALESQRSGMVEIARATSKDAPAQSGPVIVMGPGGGQPQVIQTGGGSPQVSGSGGEVQVCPRCRVKCPVGEKYCSNCGYNFYQA